MSIKRRLIAGVGVIAIAIATQFFAISAGAATQTVTTNANSGSGSLRSAIAAAGNGDIVTFDPSLNGQTITLASGQIVITKSITIDATGLAVTVDGNSASRIFTVNSGLTVSIKHLTLQHGKVADLGGAILNNGTLTVRDSVFSTNSTTGVNHTGAAIDSTFALTVTRSVFTLGHSSDLSGAIENDNGTSLVIDQSSFINNAADNDGGAISNDGDGLRITNSTFANNTTAGIGGAIWGSTGTERPVISSSTFVGNRTTGNQSGGAFHGAPQITDSIVANNTATGANTPNNCDTVATAATDKGFNLEFGASTCGFTLNAASGDPKLGGPQDNGGGLPTAALGEGSAAIDTGTCTDPNNGGATIATDERGVTRPQRAGCDIGAFELAPVAVATASAQPGLPNAGAGQEPGAPQSPPLAPIGWGLLIASVLVAAVALGQGLRRGIAAR